MARMGYHISELETCYQHLPNSNPSSFLIDIRPAMAEEILTQRTYKFRLYPSPAHQTLLAQTLGLCCELYNAALQERRDAYRISKTFVTYQEQQNQLPDIKELRPELKIIHSQVLQDVLR